MIFLDNFDAFMEKQLKEIHKEKNIEDIAEYVRKLTNNFFNFEEAKKVVNRLMEDENYTKEDFLSHKADKAIIMYVKFKKIKEASVSKPNEKKEKTPLKTIIKKYHIKAVAISLAAILSVAATLKIADIIITMNEDAEISDLLSSAADIDKGMNIVLSNTTYKGSIEDYITIYDSRGIAKDIIKICNKEPKLIDIALYKVYFGLNFNKLATMEDIVRIIKNYASEDESLNYVTETLNFSSFLDYVFENYISANNPNYFKYKEAVKEYNKNKSYYDLSPEIQEMIDGIMEEYEKGRDNLYAEYKDDLTELVQPNEGGRK